MDNAQAGIIRQKARKHALGKMLPLGLSVALAASITTAPASAFADAQQVYEAASIQVTQPQTKYGEVANFEASYDAYKIFDANIDENDHASHIQWASDNAKTAALAFFDSLTGDESYSSWLTTSGLTQEGAHDNAQNAASFIAERIAGDTDDDFFDSVPPAKMRESFADRFARAIQGANPEVGHLTSVSMGQYTYAHTISGGTEGYYLIIATPSSIDAGESGASPMWVPLGGSLSQIQAKEATASVSMSAIEDSTYSGSSAVDANIGQNISHVIVGHYPTNLKSFSKYYDQYTITFPECMSTENADHAVLPEDFRLDLNGSYPDESNPNGRGMLITITGDNIDQYDGINIEVDGQQATITIDDLQALYDSVKDDYPAGLRFTAMGISFKAHLDESAAVGAAGNTSTLVRTYTKDPVTLDTTTSQTLAVKYFTYQAHVTKIDKTSHAPLQGAGFYIKTNTDYDLSWSTSDYYVQADGSLASTPYEFFTGADGTFDVLGLDAGTYTLIENTVPTDYSAPDSDTVLTISSMLSFGAQLASFGASVTGGEAAVLPGDAATALVGRDSSAGKVDIQIVNEKSFEMPLTGLKGNQGLYVLAAVLAIGGAAVVIAGMRRARKKESRD